jgi:hypothetical protein
LQGNLRRAAFDKLDIRSPSPSVSSASQSVSAGVQRRERIASHDGLLGITRGAPGPLGGHCAVRTDDRVDPLDPSQQLLDQLQGRKPALADQAAKLACRGKSDGVPAD